MGNKQFKVSIKAIQLIIHNFDDVMTDTGVLVGQNGLESVWCNLGDGLGVDRFHALEIPN